MADRIVQLVIFLLGGLALAALFRLDVLRPGSFARCRTLRTPTLAPELWLLGAMSVFLTMILVVGIVYTVSFQLVMPEGASADDARAAPGWVGPLATSAGQLAGIAAGFAVLALARRNVRRDRMPVIGVLPTPGTLPRDLLLTTLAMLAFVPIYLSLQGLISAVSERFGDPPPEIAHDTLERLVADPTPTNVLLLAGPAVILAPIVEEVLYRLFLQTGVRRFIHAVAHYRALAKDPGTPEPPAHLGVWTSILVTSVLFALAHAPAVPWQGIAGLFVVSVAFGIVYERSGRLLVPIFMHAVFNALNVALSLALLPN